MIKQFIKQNPAGLGVLMMLIAMLIMTVFHAVGLYLFGPGWEATVAAIAGICFGLALLIYVGNIMAEVEKK